MDEDHTRILPHRAPKTPPPPSSDDEPTIVYRPKAAAAVPAAPAMASADPVTGWLVIRRGPGRGYALTLGHGMHSLGRGENQRLCLPYGDRGISHDKHCVVTYDGRGRRFYVSPGAALAHLNGQPVLQALPLEAGNILSLGETELTFVPFCGEGFDWQEA